MIFPPADPIGSKGLKKRQATPEDLDPIWGKGLSFTHPDNFFQPEKKAAGHFFRLQSHRTLVATGEDPAPDPVIDPVMEMIKAMVKFTGNPKFFKKLAPGRLLVTFAGLNHPAGRDIVKPRVDILGQGPQLDKKLATTIADQDVRSPVNQLISPHLGTARLADFPVQLIDYDHFFLSRLHSVDQVSHRFFTLPRRFIEVPAGPPQAAISACNSDRPGSRVPAPYGQVDFRSPATPARQITMGG
jgi:hypothetical protein